MPPTILQNFVRKTPSVAPILHRGVLAITGSHSSEFLNGLLSSSIREPLGNKFSSFLHAQGRVMYDVFLYATTDGYFLEYDSRASEAPPLLSYLKRHVLRSKVKIRNVIEEYDIWAAWGSSEDRRWETRRQWDWARSGAIEPIWNVTQDWPWGTREGIIHDRRAVGMGSRLLVKKGTHPQAIATHDIVSSDEYILHRIMHGVPEGIHDIPPMQSFPMDSNLDIMGAVDFRKGCYVGQELTVRTYHTGVIRKRILPVRIHTPEQERYEDAPLQFPHNLDLKPVPRQGPRPRGTGKLLSTQKGVGLALLRMEHISGVHKGDLRLELEVSNAGDKTSTWVASPWWPDCWPREPQMPLESEVPM